MDGLTLLIDPVREVGPDGYLFGLGRVVRAPR